MKKISLLIIYAAVYIFSGCASEPSIREMQNESRNYILPETAENNSSIVYVIRPWAFRGGLGRYNVYLDDQEKNSEVGYTKNGRFIYFSVTPGMHIVYSKADNWDSVSIKADPGENVFIKLRPVWGYLLGGCELEIISEIEGKYLVKNSRKGTINKEKEINKTENR